jgi:hypothetical protein
MSKSGYYIITNVTFSRDISTTTPAYDYRVFNIEEVRSQASSDILFINIPLYSTD